MDVQVYFRKAFSVEAVQVSEANINEIGTWCGGHLETDNDGLFLRVKVHKPMTPRQTKAYVGDWLLKSNRGFKVYTDMAFSNTFLKDEGGRISRGWADMVGNVFDKDQKDNVGNIVSMNDAISGKR